MAIVKMSKLRLAGVAYERNDVLDALQRTGAVQVETAELETDLNLPQSEAAKKSAELTELLAREQSAIETLTDVVRRGDKKKENAKEEPLSPYCDVTYSQFISVAEREPQLRETFEAIEKYREEKTAADARRTRIESEIDQLRPFLALDAPFSAVASTRHAMIVVGSVPAETVRVLYERTEEEPLFYVRELSAGSQSAAVLFAAHVSVSEQAEALLGQVGFAKCPFSFDGTAAERIAQAEEERRRLDEREKEAETEIYRLKSAVQDLKTLADYHAYQLEKASLSETFGYTEKTFALTGYVPTEAKEAVEAEVRKTTDAVYFEFEEPSEDDEVPTLLRNKKVVQPLEFVTNLYSVPSYRERDPNTLMGIFFMLFFGFIMADLGYGLLITIAGFAVGLKMRKSSGARPLVLLIAYGGIFTMIWGALFGSFFGYGLFPSVMPNPEREPATLLVYCLAVGIVQILVGYLVKGVHAQSNGAFWDGLFDGYIWSVFCVGILMLIPDIGVSLFNANIGFAPPSWLMTAGFAVAGAALLIAACSAGRKEKFLGKFTKGFGAVYGVINFLSDVLSYARLFGLMLSGAIVARIVTEMSVGMMTSVGGIIGGVIILLVGHAFNLAMNLLGAYIHDSRLQYIEYYSRFYQGEGTLFRPLGSKLNYITIQ